MQMQPSYNARVNADEKDSDNDNVGGGGVVMAMVMVVVPVMMVGDRSGGCGGDDVDCGDGGGSGDDGVYW